MHNTKCRYHKNARSSAGKNNNTAHVASWPTATHHDSINCRDHRLKDVHRHSRRRHRHQDNDDQDGGHRDDDGDVDEKNVQEKLCTGLHWALCTGRCALVCTGRVQQSSLFATCPEIQPVLKFHQIISTLHGLQSKSSPLLQRS